MGLSSSDFCIERESHAFSVRLGSGQVTPILFLHISSSWVKIRLNAENQLTILPGGGHKV